MATSAGPNNVKEGLIFGYDTGYPQYSNNKGTVYHPGRPTTNVSSGYGMSTYNNVGSDVTSNLFTISETFKGATVYRQVLTPITSTGVSYLTGGNNPGIGVVTSGGGGTGGVYTGHSIFFRPTVPMHSSPIYTHYSNIGGWQSSNLYEYVGEGWYRAFVTWYDTVTRSDGKYWAINPQSAVLNRSITIDWAGPFRENLNSQTVTPYVYTSRSVTECLKDIKKTYTVDVSNVSFDSSNSIFFDGTNDVILTSFGAQTIPNVTIEAVVYRNQATGRYESIIQNNTAGDDALYVYPNGTLGFWPHGASSLSVPVGQYSYVAASYNGSGITYCVNGNFATNSGASSDITDWDFLRIGGHSTTDSERWIGKIPVARVYNIALSQAQISQNFATYKTRFGI